MAFDVVMPVYAFNALHELKRLFEETQRNPLGLSKIQQECNTFEAKAEKFQELDVSKELLNEWIADNFAFQSIPTFEVLQKLINNYRHNNPEDVRTIRDFQDAIDVYTYEIKKAKFSEKPIYS